MRISLTFDDGPNTVTTAKVLDILEQYNIKASFFLIGNLINEDSKKMIEREVKLGCTIENHSWTHSFMDKMLAEVIRDEIKKTSDLIEEITGDKPQFFRPPFIQVNDTMWDNIDLPFICGQGVEDWVPEVSAEERAKRVLESACDGEIILLHDLLGNDNTVEAMKIFIPKLIEMGAEFMTVREIFKSCGVNPAQKGKLWTFMYK